ncbi:MAG: glycosyltransferase [Burkholderiales bacterium]|nr:glycosyltransferase [Burkholderiales bacterium]
MFSIIIPTWNNLDFLKLCVESIRKNSSLPAQIIVHVNDGSDGSLAWVKQEGLAHTHSPQNIGICHAVNIAATLAKHAYLVYLNDDMYCCPGWDRHLHDKIAALDTDLFMLSGTMIEPAASGNACVSVADYGRDPASFDEQTLLANLGMLTKRDWYGATWPPTVVHRDWWFKVGGYSSEFSPGMSSDNDFSMKLWHAGCRIFLGVGNSLVYHFQSKTTGKIVKNDGGRQFLHKWGMRQSTFDRYYLRRGQVATGIRLPEPEDSFEVRWSHWRSKLKRRLA